MKKLLWCLTVLGLALAAAPASQAGEMTFNTVLYAAGEKVDVPFTTTDRVPKAQLDGTVRVTATQASIELKYSKMEPALLFGGDISAWVVWSISPDGTLENLGELPVRESRGGEVSFTTKNLNFAMFVTAEPFPFVRVPSDLVAFVSGPVKAKLAKNGTVSFAGLRTDIKREHESIAKMKYEDKTPVELQQARKALALLERYNASKFAPKQTTDARTAVAQAEDALAERVGKSSDVPMLSQQALTMAYEAARQTRRGIEAEKEAEMENKRQAQIAGLETRSVTAEQAQAQTATQLAEVQRQRTQLEADVAKLAKDRKALEADRDRLAKRLSGALGEVAQVNETARGMVLNLSGEILFDTGKSKLKSEAQMRLAKLSGILLMLGDSKVAVEGHTDSTGSEATNMKLSQERAAAVADFLRSQGIQQERITTKGLGPASPVAENETAEGRAKNRRVEIVLSKES